VRWPWSKDKCDAGTQAREKATADLADAAAQWPEVRRVSKSLRELRERNHFAQQLERIYEGGGRP
jgi:hypothetical protein